MQNEHTGYILLNCGSKTQEDFMGGISNAPVHTYRTKEMILSIQSDGTPVFVYNNAPIHFDAKYVFLRLRATDAHFCGMIVEYLRAHTIPTNDPIHQSYPHSAEKISQMLLLALSGIRVPATHIFREESFAANRAYLKAHLRFPLIYKLDGSQGRNVHLLTSFEELEEIITRKPLHRLALVQTFIENTFDTRTLVFENEVLGTISRTRTGGYLNNIAQGATAAPYALTEEEKEIAIRAAEACRIDFAGVDMIHTKDGPVILEVNKSPQVKGFEAAHECKVFSMLAERIRRKHS